MIPALLAAPLVQGVVGGMVGGVMNAFASPSAQNAGAPPFNPYLEQAAGGVQVTPLVSSSTGSMRSAEWNEMSPTDVQTWVKSLAGKHVNATDETGRTFSGVVGGMQMVGTTLGLNIGGRLVSLSQLKQISWSPATTS